jgi:glycosyltransferase involved in cell wall biosynthesis
LRDIRKIALFAVGDAAWQGGIQYITNILNALNSVGGEKRLEVHLFRQEFQLFPELSKFTKLDIHLQDVEKVLPGWSLARRIVWFGQRKLTGRIYPRLEDYLIKNKFDFAYPVTLSSCNGKLNSGSWIADFQYHHFPGGANAKIIAGARKTISEIAHKTDKIILSSKFCEADSFNLFPVTKGKTHVMPFAVFVDEEIFRFEHFDQLLSTYSIPRRFMMVANLFAPTKNHKTLFNALGILGAKGVAVNLVCTGNIVDYRNHGYANEILESITRNGIRQQVHLLGLIPRPDQVQLYRMAVALIQPSVSEGWSTAVEEAKALGKSLILSDIPVHLEQYPGNPYFFSSMSAEELAEKIATVWNASEGKSFPDKEVEAGAYSRYQQAVKQFGNRFLQIAAS